MAADDLSVSFPFRGVIRLRSRALFADAEGLQCRRFVERVFEAAEITGVTIRGGAAPHADLRFHPGRHRREQVVRRVASALRGTRPAVGSIAAARDRRGVVRSFHRHANPTVPDAGLDRPSRPDRRELHLPLCTASLPIAAAAQFAAPGLLPLAAGVLACTSIPTFREACRALVRERRVGGDALRSIVFIGCLGTMSIFPGAVLCWCLSFGRSLVKRTRDHSKTLLFDAFAGQPRHAWLYRDGASVRVPLDRLEQGSIVVVEAGEFVPVNGRVVKGTALIDEYALTGARTPAEKGIGDRVFAAALVLGGRLFVSVEDAGSETAAARIGRLLEAALGDELSSRYRGERLADRAVLPTLGLGALGLAAVGPGAAVAVLGSDLGAGLRIAAPLAVLGALALSADKGIVVKDGRALERMSEVDTVLIAATAAVALQRPAFRDLVDGLRARGIDHIAFVSGDIGGTTARTDDLEALRQARRKICWVGDGLHDAAAVEKAHVSISLRGDLSIAGDAAEILFLEDDLGKLCELRDIARDLDRNLRRSWSMILAPNIACIAGVFTMGLGITASVLTSNVAALAALACGALPLREVAQLEAERRHRLELNRSLASDRADSEPPAPLAARSAAVYDVY